MATATRIAVSESGTKPLGGTYACGGAVCALRKIARPKPAAMERAFFIEGLRVSVTLISYPTRPQHLDRLRLRHGRQHLRPRQQRRRRHVSSDVDARLEDVRYRIE